MTRLANSRRLGQALINLRWGVRTLSPGAPTMVWSDQPVSYSLLEGAEAVLVMPIGPKEAFIATRGPNFLANLLKVPEKQFVQTTNQKTVARARSLVVAFDRSHDPLVKARFLLDETSHSGTV